VEINGQKEIFSLFEFNDDINTKGCSWHCNRQGARDRSTYLLSLRILSDIWNYRITWSKKI